MTVLEQEPAADSLPSYSEGLMRIARAFVRLEDIKNIRSGLWFGDNGQIRIASADATISAFSEQFHRSFLGEECIAYEELGEWTEGMANIERMLSELQTEALEARLNIAQYGIAHIRTFIAQSLSDLFTISCKPGPGGKVQKTVPRLYLYEKSKTEAM